MEYHGELGAETCQQPWRVFGVEYRYGELVQRSGVETWQPSWGPLESAVWTLDILMEYHEKSELW